MKVLVLGNCQARPLAQILQQESDRIQVVDVGIVHLLRNDQRNEFQNKMQQADVILAQLVAHNYPCDFVRTVSLKSEFPEKVLVWPNLYYSGYNPELTYVRAADRTPLGGPLGDYHSQVVLDAWRYGLSAGEALRRTLDPDHNIALYKDAHCVALEQLRQREESTDFPVSDWIEEHAWQQRLFFTMNHPKSTTLLYLAGRIMAGLGMSDCRQTDNLTQAEPLGAFDLPLNSGIRVLHDPKFPAPPIYTGNEVIPGKTPQQTRRRKDYTADEIIHAWYEIYDSATPFLEN